MDIYIVRHGQTDCNDKKIVQGWLNSELNEFGIQQAKNVADELEGVLFDIIYSSDLNRAYNTAKIIAENLPNYSGEIKTDSRLRERCLGDLEGASSDNIDHSVYFSDNSELHFESMADFKNRVSGFLNDLSNMKSYVNVLIVTHNGTMNIFEKLLGIKSEDLFRDNGEIIKAEYKKSARLLYMIETIWIAEFIYLYIVYSAFR